MTTPQIDPSIYDALINTGGQIGAMDPQIQQQQAMAAQLRQQGQDPGLIQAGRRVVAPSKMAYAGALADQAVAGQKTQQAMQLMQQQSALKQQQAMQVIAALRGQLGQQGQQPPGAQPPVQQGPGQGMQPAPGASGMMGG